MASRAHVLFRIAGEAFALPSTAVAEILPIARLATPPGLPPVLAGFLNLDGAVVAVLRAHILLELDGDPAGLDAHMLHLRDAEPATAILVDRVTSVEPVDDSDARPVATDQTFRDGVVAEIDGFDHPVHLISIERLLSDGERRKLAFFAEAERRHLAQFDDVATAEDLE